MSVFKLREGGSQLSRTAFLPFVEVGESNLKALRSVLQRKPRWSVPGAQTSNSAPESIPHHAAADGESAAPYLGENRKKLN